MRGVFVPVCLCSCKSLNATGQRDVFFRRGGEGGGRGAP